MVDPELDEELLPEAEAEPDEDDDGPGELFTARDFGGEFVWAEAPGYTSKILRVKPGKNVIVSTRGRKDMIAMLTGGRAVLEVIEGDDVDRVELMPGAPIVIEPDRDYRLVALTEVELFTIYSPLD
jgi:hypothetical protein